MKTLALVTKYPSHKSCITLIDFGQSLIMCPNCLQLKHLILFNSPFEFFSSWDFFAFVGNLFPLVLFYSLEATFGVASLAIIVLAKYEFFFPYILPLS